MELKSHPPYIDQKRAGLAALAAGTPFAALRIFLAGKMPVPAAAPGAPLIAPTRPRPLLIFHVILFDRKIEAWTIDADLHGLEGLRAHIPAYLGEVATGTMHGGPWKCRLLDFAKALSKPSGWAGVEAGTAGSPPDVENDVWRLVIASKFGDDAHHFTMERIPAGALYSDAYRLHAIREITIALGRAIGISDVIAGGATLANGRPFSVQDVLDMAIDRHAIHGMVPDLRPGVCASTSALITGAWGEYGTALDARLHPRCADGVRILPLRDRFRMGQEDGAIREPRPASPRGVTRTRAARAAGRAALVPRPRPRERHWGL